MSASRLCRLRSPSHHTPPIQRCGQFESRESRWILCTYQAGCRGKETSRSGPTCSGEQNVSSPAANRRRDEAQCLLRPICRVRERVWDCEGCVVKVHLAIWATVCHTADEPVAKTQHRRDGDSTQRCHAFGRGHAALIKIEHKRLAGLSCAHSPNAPSPTAAAPARKVASCSANRTKCKFVMAASTKASTTTNRVDG